MKKIIKEITKKTIKNGFIWGLCQKIIHLSYFLANQRYRVTHVEEIKELEVIHNNIKSILKTPVVMHGPFKGLKYPDFNSHGSATFPKIIGSYESEISSIIEDTVKKGYTEIIDVGCAEGYYAVGLAMLCPDAKVFAFDIDNTARELCTKMAELNNVSERVIIKA